ncbi:copper resistance CopC family protein [Methylocystis sp. IM3]|uniref:copper resistance CopC family protein n=2 Tax=Methylocystis TaxID=133 RepID=UPI0031199282
MREQGYREHKVAGRQKAASLVATILLALTAPQTVAAYGTGAAPDAPTLATPGAPRKIELTGPSAPRAQAGKPILMAHAIIVRTSPPQGGAAEGGIGKVDVWYDAGIRDAFAALAVVSASGERVDKRDAAIDSADAAHVSVSVNPLTAGKYTVRYRALSADGHLVSGAWEFEVRP